MRRMAAGSLAIGLVVCPAASAFAAPPATASGAPIELPLDDDDVTPASLDTVPSNTDLMREYPRLALQMSLGGRAAMKCLATPEGRLDDCHVVSESPAGLGFGAATVRASAYCRVAPARRGGKPTLSSITIPMRWMMDSAAKPTPDPDPALPPVSPGALALARQVVRLEDLRGRTLSHWLPWLQQQSVGLVEVDDAQAGQRALDALRQGLTETVDAEMERSAHLLAASMNEAQLQATVTFLGSLAGRAFTLEASHFQDRQDFGHMAQRIAAAARPHLCQDGGCTVSAPTKSASR